MVASGRRTIHSMRPFGYTRSLRAPVEHGRFLKFWTTFPARSVEESRASGRVRLARSRRSRCGRLTSRYGFQYRLNTRSTSAVGAFSNSICLSVYRTVSAAAFLISELPVLHPRNLQPPATTNPPPHCAQNDLLHVTYSSSAPGICSVMARSFMPAGVKSGQIIVAGTIPRSLN